MAGCALASLAQISGQQPHVSIGQGAGQPARQAVQVAGGRGLPTGHRRPTSERIQRHRHIRHREDADGLEAPLSNTCQYADAQQTVEP
jgi:hypothetical protein